jgi:hypothetical protein
LYTQQVKVTSSPQAFVDGPGRGVMEVQVAIDGGRLDDRADARGRPETL